jgi:hypothetical protein
MLQSGLGAGTAWERCVYVHFERKWARKAPRLLVSGRLSFRPFDRLRVTASELQQRFG